jgi:hypothetical protein
MIGWLVVSFAWAGPMGPGIAVRQVVPPPTVIEGVSTLQVAQFEGPHGDRIRQSVLAGLLNVHRERGLGTIGDVAGGMVAGVGAVGGALVDAKLKGIGGSIAAGAVTNTTEDLGEMLVRDKVVLDDGLRIDVFQVVPGAADAVLSVQIDVDEVDEPYTETRPQRDDDGNVVRDEEGAELTEEVGCVRRAAQAEVTWAVVGAGGAKLAGAVVPRSSAASACGEDRERLPPHDELASVALHGVGSHLVAELAPAWKAFRIPMRKGPSVREMLGQIRKGEHTDALCTLDHVARLVPEDRVVHQVRGALLEALGHHDQALVSYAAVVGLKSADKMAGNAMRRVEGRKVEVDTLTRAYGLTWGVGALDLSGCPPLPDGRPVVTKRATTLKTAADASGGVELAKGERLFVLEEGALLRVATLGGSEGWVDPKHVR